MRRYEGLIKEKLEHIVRDGYVRFRCRCGNYVDFKREYLDSLTVHFPLGIACNECGRIIKWNLKGF